MRGLPVRLLATWALTACATEFAPDPVALDVTLSPSRQWVGAAVTLQAARLADISTTDIQLTGLVPLDSTAPEGRHLVAFTRPAPDRVTFLAWGYSGTRTVQLDVRGFLPSDLTFEAVGARGPLWPFGWNWVTGWAPVGETGRVLAGSQYPRGYRILDLRSGEATSIAPLTRPSDQPAYVVKIPAPGPSYRTGHFVVDLSHLDSAAAAQVWAVGPGFAMRYEGDLDCGFATRSGPWWYAAAELPGGVCLTLRDGTLRRGRTETLWSDPALRPASEGRPPGELRIANNGRWVAVAGPLPLSNEDLTSWPVLDGDGRVVYVLDRFAHVLDAEFSPDGDTLFVLAAGPRDSTNTRSRWVEALVASTGMPLGRVDLPPGGNPVALRVDPRRAWIYVGGSDLFVIDRRTWEFVTAVPGCYALRAGALVLDGDVIHDLFEYGDFEATLTCDIDIL